jgi:hypothetical protein
MITTPTPQKTYSITPPHQYPRTPSPNQKSTPSTWKSATHLQLESLHKRLPHTPQSPPTPDHRTSNVLASILLDRNNPKKRTYQQWEPVMPKQSPKPPPSASLQELDSLARLDPTPLDLETESVELFYELSDTLRDPYPLMEDPPFLPRRRRRRRRRRGRGRQSTRWPAPCRAATPHCPCWRRRPTTRTPSYSLPGRSLPGRRLHRRTGHILLGKHWHTRIRIPYSKGRHRPHPSGRRPSCRMETRHGQLAGLPRRHQ